MSRLEVSHPYLTLRSQSPIPKPTCTDIVLNAHLQTHSHTPCILPLNGKLALFCLFFIVYSYTQSSEELSGRGIVIGCYDNSDSAEGYELSDVGQSFDSTVEGRLSQLLAVSGGRVKRGETRVLYDVTTDHTHVAVVGVGPRNSDNGLEDVDMKRQNVRCAAAGKTSSCTRLWAML